MRWFWLDRFTEFTSGERATAVKCIALSEDYLHDHWPGYPTMPNSLVAEGMAQTAGLLVSEAYGFRELVVLAKFSRCTFDGQVRPGEVLTYRAEIQQIKEAGASAIVTADVADRRYAEAEIFFARMEADAAPGRGEADMAATDALAERRLFDPAHLLHWLRLVGVFEVGVRPDGTRLQATDYDFPTS